jgi:hypothetical protein
MHEKPSQSDLSPEWRQTIAANWQRMLPHMHRGLERIEQRLDSEDDPNTRHELGQEIARRRDKLREAEAAIQTAMASTQAECQAHKTDSAAAQGIAAELAVAGWRQGPLQEGAAEGRTAFAERRRQTPEVKSMPRSLIARSLALAADRARAITGTRIARPQ